MAAYKRTKNLDKDAQKAGRNISNLRPIAIVAVAGLALTGAYVLATHTVNTIAAWTPAWNVAWNPAWHLGPNWSWKEQPVTVTGRARAVTGDSLQLGEQQIRLAGIAAPLPQQRCRNRRGQRWRCGRTARRILARLVRRKTVSCEFLKSTGVGRCATANGDLAAAVVARGYAFLETGRTEYARQMREAKRARRGVWQGKSRHPDDLRDKL